MPIELAIGLNERRHHIGRIIVSKVRTVKILFKKKKREQVALRGELMGDVAGRESVTKYQFLSDINDLKK